MKDLLRKITIRDKTITAACRTPDGIEWTTLKIKQDGTESMRQNSMPLALPEELTEQELADVELPENLSEQIAGEVTVALRASELLMRTQEFPTNDPNEIAGMIGFQIDKVSPFPMDQLAVSHEILSTGETTACVLMAAAKRKIIDAIGDAFETKGVRIHSIDARALGWLQLLRDSGKLPETGCALLVISDGIDFVLMVLNESLPIVFRSLPTRIDDMTIVDELTYEIGYTLTTLDAELDLPKPTTLQMWSIEEIPSALCTKLSEKSGLEVTSHTLNELPPLSEGLLRRTRSTENRIELIPTEWVEHQKRQKLQKQFFMISGSIVAVWLLIMLVFTGIFKVRDLRLNAAKADAAAIAPAAQQAASNQKKLRALKEYSDRSDSSLECLREVTALLPAGDIEFVSYNYKKGDGVTLRGTARDDNIVYDFFKTLTKSELFERLRDQSVNTKTTKGVRRAVFSLKLELPAKEDEE